MINFLDPLPTWLIMLVSALLIFAMSEVGFQLGQRKTSVQLVAQSMGAAPSPSP